MGCSWSVHEWEFLGSAFTALEALIGDAMDGPAPPGRILAAVSGSARQAIGIENSGRRHRRERRASTPTANMSGPANVAASLFKRSKKLDLGCFVNVWTLRDHTKRKAFEATEAER